MEWIKLVLLKNVEKKISNDVWVFCVFDSIWKHLKIKKKNMKIKKNVPIFETCKQQTQRQN